MTRTHDALVDRQFGPQAQAYVQSAVHAEGADLDLILQLATRAAPRRALDLGTGGGHVAHRLAQAADEVVACDLSKEMLAAVEAETAKRGLSNLRVVQAPAERLPCEDGAFGFLACRFSAHHWRDLDQGLAEARRVAAPGATAVFVDGTSVGGALFDTHLQAIELLRDPSHVRDYSPAEWSAALARAGFRLDAMHGWRLRMDFSSWVARMRAPPLAVEAIRALQDGASAEVRDHFAIEPDGSFQLDVLMLQATAA